MRRSLITMNCSSRNRKSSLEVISIYSLRLSIKIRIIRIICIVAFSSIVRLRWTVKNNNSSSFLANNTSIVNNIKIKIRVTTRWSRVSLLSTVFPRHTITSKWGLINIVLVYLLRNRTSITNYWNRPVFPSVWATLAVLSIL